MGEPRRDIALADGGIELGTPPRDERLDERRASTEQRGDARREPIAQGAPAPPLGVEQPHPAQRENPQPGRTEPPPGDDPRRAAVRLGAVGPTQPHGAPARAADRIRVHDAAARWRGIEQADDH